MKTATRFCASCLLPWATSALFAAAVAALLGSCTRLQDAPDPRPAATRYELAPERRLDTYEDAGQWTRPVPADTTRAGW
ncbi:hypothetical protein [Hymenobacter lapidiphilus]|uniref:Uncharacterized protein n=1 Tax=Hymenobacter lapidiphilus TaxID=2608003 RepID=A0A7Y7U8E9_9BACT|nr:hypothetical protein [Hymenobacter lapidiphilus]NVO33510.1 hypothetical protein [Hymenobacter lapidiphilus]